MTVTPAATGATASEGGLRLLKVDEVAALLDVNHRTVRKLIASGELRVVRVRRVLRVREDEVRRFIAEHEEP